MMTPLLRIMIQAIKKASTGILRDFGELEHLQINQKGVADFVSAADIRTEQILKEELGKARPQFSFLGEEEGETSAPSAKTPEGRWIIDPIDGTSNFINANPHFCISLALEQSSEIVAALIYDILRDEFFMAEKGQGAFLNQKRIRCAKEDRADHCLFATGIPRRGSKKDVPLFLEQLQTVMVQTAGIRRSGSAALDLAWTAAGRLSGYWEDGVNYWDVAAGILLVREAGGFVTDFKGAPFHPNQRKIVAGGGAHGLLSGFLEEARRTLGLKNGKPSENKT